MTFERTQEIVNIVANAIFTECTAVRNMFPYAKDYADFNDMIHCFLADEEDAACCLWEILGRLNLQARPLTSKALTALEEIMFEQDENEDF